MTASFWSPQQGVFQSTIDQIIEILVGQGLYRGIWTLGEDYDAGEYVLYGETLYLLLNDVTNATTFPPDDPTNYRPISLVNFLSFLADPANGLGIDLVANGTRGFASVDELRAYPTPMPIDDRIISALLIAYNVDTTVGGGPIFWNATDTRADDGGTVFNPDDNTGDGRWNRIFAGPVTPEMFGCAGDGIVDDLPRMQAAVNYMLLQSLSTATGFGVTLLGDANASYRLDGRIVFGQALSFCWNFDMNGAELLQVQDNEPIISIEMPPSGLTYSATIQNICARWVNNQPIANLNSAVIRVNQTADGVAANFFNGTVRNINSYNGCRIISNPDQGPSRIMGFWGMTIEKIIRQFDCSGSAIWLGVSGQPANHITHVYCNGGSGPGEEAIYLRGQNSIKLGVIEANIWNRRAVTITGCTNVVWDIYHHEFCTIPGGDEVIYIENSQVRFKDINWSSFTAGPDAAFISVDVPGASSRVDIDYISSGGGCSTTSGVYYWVRSTTFEYPIKIGAMGPLNFFSTGEVYLDPNLATAVCVQILNPLLYEVNFVDNGDADRTFTVYTDAPTQRFTTTFTANRTVTLAQTNTFNGARFTIIWDAATPGAFTCDVVSSAGTVYTKPINVRASATFIWVVGSNWRLESVATLP